MNSVDECLTWKFLPCVPEPIYASGLLHWHTGGVIASVDFAAFGGHTGRCGAYAHASPAVPAQNEHVRRVVEERCVGHRACTVPADPTVLLAQPASLPLWEQPRRRLVVQARCSNQSKQHTYWNFTLLDHQMLDVWTAVQGDTRPQIPNFSTPPTWLYDLTSWGYSTVCTGNGSDGCLSPGYEKGTAPATAHGGLPALGDYYGRLLAWYMRGGMYDEYGEFHASGHRLNITVWEVYNEVDHEHQHTPATYTQDFDAIVQGIRKHADPNRTIAFVGMSLPNIDNTDAVVAWATYFLNASNHAPAAQDALQYIGYHAYPTAAYPMHTKDDLSQLFAYVDDFVDNKIAAVQAVIDRLSPGTKTLLDECGTTGPMFGGLDDPTYWVASGAYWAYLWARAAVLYGDKVCPANVSQPWFCRCQAPRHSRDFRIESFNDYSLVEQYRWVV
eukprot:m.655786 g.655786  ORF g.655786 m.655786 type:complete len:443 (+) comp22698_c0_seq27:1120-2448(+)